MTTTLEVLGIFLRLFIAVGCAIAAGVIAGALAFWAGSEMPLLYAGIALGFVITSYVPWIFGE